MRFFYIILLTLFFGSTIVNGQKFTEAFINAQNIRKISSDLYEEIVLFASDDQFYIFFNDSIKSFTTFSYKDPQNKTQNVSLKGNIKEFATDGETSYLSTKDNHLLYFTDNKFIGGLPIIIYDLRFYPDDETVSAVVDARAYGSSVFVAVLDRSIGKFYNGLECANNICYNPLHFAQTFNSNLFSFHDGKSLGIATEAQQLILFDNVKSYYPFSKVQSLSAESYTENRFKHVLAAVISEENNLFILKKSVENSELSKPILTTNWKSISEGVVNGKLLKSFVYKSNSVANTNNVFIYGIIEKSSNNFFILNPQNNQICFYTIPNNSIPRDIHMINKDQAYILSGASVFKVDLTNIICRSGLTPLKEIASDNLIAHPNPSNGDFVIDGKIKDAKLYNVNGRIVTNFHLTTNDNFSKIHIDGHSGIYILKFLDESLNFKSIKLIKQN